MAGAESVSSQPAAVKPCTPDWALGRAEPAASHFLTLVSWSLVKIGEIWIKDILQDFKSETLSWTNIFSKSSVGGESGCGVVPCPIQYTVSHTPCLRYDGQFWNFHIIISCDFVKFSFESGG